MRLTERKIINIILNIEEQNKYLHAVSREPGRVETR